MDKTITVIKTSDPRNCGYVPGTMAERIAMVWPLTCEAASLSGKYDTEQRLQRHITRIIRLKDKADAQALSELIKK
jgi:hypothetical protein